MLKRRTKRRVPKEFLKPRPMSGPVPRRVLLWRYLPLRVVAIVAGVAATLLCTWLPIDDWWYATLLGTYEDSTPSEQVTVVTLPPNTVVSGQCGERLSAVLTRAGAKAGLLLTPTADLCAPAEVVPGLDSELIPPMEATADQLFRRRGGRVLGLAPDGITPLLDSLGVQRARWLMPAAAGAVPVISLDRLSAGELEASLLVKRIAVVALADATGEPRVADRAGAAALASALRGGRRYPLLPWATLLLAAALCTLQSVAMAQRQRRLVRFGFYGVLGLGLAVCTALPFISDLLVPAPSLVVSLAAAWFVAELPRRIAAFRADRSAERLLRKASKQLHAHSPHIDEAEFWRNLARKAAQAHPADDVLVAELPPFSWRLKVWPNGELDESVIKERRRDIRRTPYANLQGVPVASVTADYLVMKGVPATLVPLICRGEVEGYLMLIGQVAADYFTDNPDVTQQLADDMAMLIRSRRQLQQQEDDFRHPVGLPGEVRGGAAEEVLVGAKTALAELRLMNTVVQSSPVGLCYADPFGDVRILGKTWLKWVPHLNAELPMLAQQGTLRPGELGLRQLLGRVTQQVAKPAPLLSSIDESGFLLDIPVSRGQDSDAKALRVSVVRLEEDEGRVGGFLASLMELPSRTGSLMPRASQAPQQGDPLAVFSLSRMLQRAVTGISNDTRSKVKLQTPRVEAHIVGHRREVKETLEEFLVAAGQLAGKGSGPIVSVHEHEQRVQVRILDLKLGAPVAALERTVMAPSVPPAGLAPLGNLVRAVENSHGYVELKTNESWGLELSLSFIKARPRIENPEAVLTNLRQHNRLVNI